jgi:hypothetical protein
MAAERPVDRELPMAGFSCEFRAVRGGDIAYVC